jgi:hypothetical protein
MDETEEKKKELAKMLWSRITHTHVHPWLAAATPTAHRRAGTSGPSQKVGGCGNSVAAAATGAAISPSRL